MTINMVALSKMKLENGQRSIWMDECIMRWGKSGECVLTRFVPIWSLCLRLASQWWYCVVQCCMQLSAVVTKKQTMAHIERDMARWIKVNSW